jgi:hypothetical protein
VKSSSWNRLIAAYAVPGLVVRRLDDRHARPLREPRRGDLLPALAGVARDVNEPVVRAGQISPRTSGDSAIANTVP